MGGTWTLQSQVDKTIVTQSTQVDKTIVTQSAPASHRQLD